MISSNELREKFIQYFKQQGHEAVASSSLVPGNDKTLLFTNAGMVQFKDVFLGVENRSYTRAVSSQRCVRAGGKHNDLENVGYTARHHTFFEMLGNFSFGDYFKEEAIQYAWTFLTEVVQIPKEKLWVTVYEDDDEAADIWLNKMGVPEERFGRKGKKDNFWQMGDTGPCGPCSEIFYDHGPEVAGGPPGSPDEDGDRYVEIWNLVFMQYNRAADGSLSPLPKPSVDTGMGLERLAAVLQGVHSNYDIDIFKRLIAVAGRQTNCFDLKHNSLRVIADHIRSCAFLIVDGVLPSNEGRGYVLRRIIRRAIRHGHKLGQKATFFYKLVDALVSEMGQAYPELQNQHDQIKRVLLGEEERFAETLEQGMTILESAIANLSGQQISGEVAFKLYDTYGFPIDLTADIARERQLTIDMEAFEAEMDKQRARARSSNKFKVDMSEQAKIDQKSEFTGYGRLQQLTFVTALLRDGKKVEQLSAGDRGVIVLKETPFYAESGGQVGDRGDILTSDARFEVEDTQKQGDAVLHIGVLQEGSLSLKQNVNAEVHAQLRYATVLNHSATHLMHAALRKVLGDHVQQKGSLVNEHNLRFDFSHFEAMTAEQILQVEQIVNDEIRSNAAAQAKTMSMQAAMDTGAMALFGEKYGDEVRVLSIGNFSVELCGGTHVNRAGDIGLFKIISEGGVAAGVRRIEAITGDRALAYVGKLEQSLSSIASQLKSSRDDVSNKVSSLLEKNRSLEKEISQLQSKLASASSDDILNKAVDVQGLKVLAARMDGLDSKAMRDMLDQLKNKLGAAAVVLASADGEKVRLIAGVSQNQTSRIQAGPLVNVVAQQVGGKGGGRPDMAQAGGNNPATLDQALESVVDWVRQNIS